jgi:hypothetical protein
MSGFRTYVYQISLKDGSSHSIVDGPMWPEDARKVAQRLAREGFFLQRKDIDATILIPGSRIREITFYKQDPDEPYED